MSPPSPDDDGGLRELVCCSLETWDEVFRRNQLLVSELLVANRHLRVLFVEPPLDVPWQLLHRYPVAASGARRLRRVGPTGRLWAFRPLKWLPRAIGPWADGAIERQVRDAADRLGFGRPVLWVNDPAFASLARRTGWPACYDVTDDWLAARCSARQLSARRRREAELLDRCAEVVVCSDALAASKGAERPVHVIRGGVDVERFREPTERPPDLPPGRVACYVGTLHEDRLDVGLCCQLARRLRGARRLVLVGPSALNERSRQRLVDAGALLLGARPHGAVPSYLQHADVIVVPHVVSPFTESLDPIKAWECRAVGRPTVATPVAGFRELGSPVRLASGDEFVATVADLLAGPPLPPGPGPDPGKLPGWRERGASFAEVLTAAAAARSPLRLVFLDHCARPGGAELALARLLPALPNAVSEVVLGEDGPLVGRLVRSGVRTEVVPLARRARELRRGQVGFRPDAAIAAMSTAAYCARLALRLRRRRPDLVVTNSLKSALYGGVAGRVAGVRVCWHLRDRIAGDYLPPGAVRLVRLAARVLPAGVVANSATTLGTIAARRGTVVPDACELAGDDQIGVGTRYAEPGGHRRDRDTDGGAGNGNGNGNGRGRSGDGLLIGMVGRLAPWKGQDVFLRAFALAFPGPGATACIAGEALFGEEAWREGLGRLVGRLGLTGRVEFTGQLDDVAPLLRRLDVLVHASVLAEPFGQVVVEGMAAGLPVVASAAGGPAEIVDDGTNGLLVPPGDDEALAAALRRLARDPSLRRRLGDAGRLRSRRFAPDIVGPETEAAYRAVAGR